jgi:hypothetical protein
MFICRESTTTVSLPGQISTWHFLLGEHVATSLCTGYSLNDPIQKHHQLRRNLKPEEASWVKACAMSIKYFIAFFALRG